MLVKRGTLIDATIIEAQARRPQSEAGARSGTGPDAAWTKKGKRSHFGYKMHIGMDAGSGLVRGVEFTPANVADTEAADALIMGDEEAVYADKAYESSERRERLRAQGGEGSDHAPWAPSISRVFRIGSGRGTGCCRRFGRLLSRR